MTIWMTSDLHFGHDKVANLRGFEKTNEHDDTIINNLRRRVRRHDTLWVLGDLSMPGWRTNAIARLAQIPCEKHLIAGNHDRLHPLNSNGFKYAHEYLRVFNSVSTVARLTYQGQYFMLSHFPYVGDTDGRDEDRHVEWRLRDHGVPILHGHTHSSERWNMTVRGTAQLHVGVDAWDLAPVDLHDATAALYDGSMAHTSDLTNIPSGTKLGGVRGNRPDHSQW